MSTEECSFFEILLLNAMAKQSADKPTAIAKIDRNSTVVT